MKPRSRIVRKTLAVLGMLLVFGLIRTPLEHRLTDGLISQGLLAEVKIGDLSGLAGQSASIAVLGGLRSLVAIHATLHAFDAWSYKQWDTVERAYRLIVTVLPEDVDSWKTGAWHMHSNAAASYMLDESVPEATRRQRANAWVLKGVSFLKEGLEHHPRSSAIHKELADVYREKLDEPCLAARHYKSAMEGDRPQAYVHRFYGYFLARCPGREREAHQYLMDLYAKGRPERLPTLIQRIKELEVKLAIPAGERIPDPDPDTAIRQRFPNAQLP